MNIEETLWIEPVTGEEKGQGEKRWGGKGRLAHGEPSRATQDNQKASALPFAQSFIGTIGPPRHWPHLLDPH
jgi:hypothetical protein